MWFLADDPSGQSCYVWAESWEDAEKQCNFEHYELVGQYLKTIPWPDMPKWLDNLE